ncbi:uncharacterized protein LOC143815404 [Ranitomeya variabilis]|uniref:uncharacterized protein LOC143815404 n=1 Tax=Ranitomeya variabilis TaxID=490064 RepID=UPI0040564C30
MKILGLFIKGPIDDLSRMCFLQTLYGGNVTAWTVTWTLLCADGPVEGTRRILRENLSGGRKSTVVSKSHESHDVRFSAIYMRYMQVFDCKPMEVIEKLEWITIASALEQRGIKQERRDEQKDSQYPDPISSPVIC